MYAFRTCRGKPGRKSDALEPGPSPIRLLEQVTNHYIAWWPQLTEFVASFDRDR
jgi:hypothetical protein